MAVRKYKMILFEYGDSSDLEDNQLNTMKDPLATATLQELLPSIEVPCKSASETPKLLALKLDITCTSKVVPKTKSTK